MTVFDDIKSAAESATGKDGCLLCGSVSRHPVSNVCRYGIPRVNFICKKCGLVYIDQRQERAPETYYDKRYREQYKVYDVESAVYRQMKRAKAALLIPFVPRDGRVLEIGCANGVLLDEIRQLCPCRITGIEPDSALAGRARELFEADIFTGVLEKYRGAGDFDLIILDHVLEHFIDPLRALAIIRRLLSPRGRVYVEVPNIRDPYGDLEGNFFQHVHLYSFSTRTLRMVMSRAGFSAHQEMANNGCLAMICSPAPALRRAEIDFDAEGEDWRRMVRYLEIYQAARQAERSRDAGSHTPFLDRIKRLDIELESRMAGQCLKSLREECLRNIKGGRYSEALGCVKRYYSILGVDPHEMVEMLVMGSILAGRHDERELKATLAKLLERVRETVAQSRREVSADDAS